MKPIRIVAAFDRFPEDEAVLLRGIEIAAHHGVALTVLHVVDLPGHTASAALITSFLGHAESVARDRIEVTLRRHGIVPTEVRVHVDTGDPAERLIEVCRDLAPMLVIMRTHHKPWIVRKLLGSTTEKVMAGGQTPVLVVKPTADRPYDRMLLAIDGPDTVPSALSFVTGLLPETRVHMVQAVAVAPQLEQAMLRVGLARRDLTTHHDLLAQHAEARLRSLVAGLSPGVTWQVLRGDPAQELVRATQALDVDLIALGPTRSGLLKAVFAGGVTPHVLRNAGCDVLIGCPPDDHVSDAIAKRDPATAQSAATLPPLAV